MKKSNNLLLSLGGLNIVLLGLVSLLNDFSSEMISPIWPMLITALGGTGLTIGIIGGMMDGLPQLLKVFSGYLSDKLRNRKKFIFLGYFTSELFKFMLIFAKSWIGVMAFMGLNKLGKGVREAPRDALISESLPKEKGRAFGIQRTFDSAGAILGSVSVLLIVVFFSQYFSESALIKKIILLAAIIGFISLIPLFFLKERTAIKFQSNKKINFNSSLKKLPKKFYIFLIIGALFALANFSYMFFVLKATTIFNHQGGYILPVIPIALYVLFNIFYTIFAIPFGRLYDNVGRRKTILSGYILFTIVCTGFLFFSSFFAFIVLFILYGLVYAMIVGNQRAFVSDLSPANLRATALGLFQTVIGITAIISGILAGALYDINSNYIFIFGALTSLTSVILFLIFYRKLAH
jgi:MFS family permease